MQKKFLEKIPLLLLAAVFLFFLSSDIRGADVPKSCSIGSNSRYPIMRPDEATFKKWIESYKKSPQAFIDRKRYAQFGARGSVNLLSHVSYVPAERDQGQCGNCWAWGGTGCIEIALDVQESIKNRLSIQYINSCETEIIGKTHCDGGWLADVADFYSNTKKAVPWSNTNASWQDGDGQVHTTCVQVATTPNYEISSITSEEIPTQNVAQATAIANIKNVLNQNKGVWFAFFLPNQAAWDDLFNFWDYQGESAVYDIDKFNGEPYNSDTGGGHAVLCVGYDDTDPNNSYWIMLNSWGTAGGRRPNDLFRINMKINYACANSFSYSLYFQSLDIQFNTGPAPVLNSFSLSDRTSGSTQYTRERTVNVAVTASGSPAQSGFSANSDFSGATWQTYNTSATYTLPAGDGQKTIYCRLKNSGGSESNTRSASIYLDTTVPSVDFQLNNHDLKTGDYINDKPDLQATITEAVGVVESSLKLTKDGTQISDGTSGGGRYDSYDPVTKTLTYSFKNNLNVGAHALTFQVADIAGNTTTLTFNNLTVASSPALESVVNYPNPFNDATFFSYQLAKEATVVIKIFTTRGELVKTLMASAGGTGGQLGFNKISWNGTNEAENILPNGMYLYIVTATASDGSRFVKTGKVGITR